VKTSLQGANADPLEGPQDFSLVLGGPLFQLLLRLRLSDTHLELLRRRLTFIPLLCWLPLFLLSALEGNLFESEATIPFLRDLETHARFLVAMPLLILAEMVVHQRMLPMVRQFKERELVPKDAIAVFDGAIAAARRLRNSVTAEVLLVALVYCVGVLIIWQHYTAIDTFTWYAKPSAAGPTLSVAGMWYGYFSLPVFQFLLCRWYFRIFIWARFLRSVSRINLQIVPTHPDKLGGLGFLAGTVSAFVPLAVAHGALVAGQLAARILHLGAKLPEFKSEILVLVIFLSVLVHGPLLAFVAQLARAKRKGQIEYGAFAQRYVREFDVKWLRGGAPADEPLVGSGDIQSLADLGNSLDVVRSMRAVPVTKEAVVQLVAATLIPILPLMLTMMPLEELLRTLFGMLF